MSCASGSPCGIDPLFGAFNTYVFNSYNDFSKLDSPSFLKFLSHNVRVVPHSPVLKSVKVDNFVGTAPNSPTIFNLSSELSIPTLTLDDSSSDSSSAPSPKRRKLNESEVRRSLRILKPKVF